MIRRIIPRIALILICAYLAYDYFTSPAYIIAVLLSVALCSFCTAAGGIVPTIISCSIFIVISLIYKVPFLYFLPLTVYEASLKGIMLVKKKPVINKQVLFPALVLSISIAELSMANVSSFILIVISLLCVYIAYINLYLSHLNEEVFHEEDNKRELEQLMKQHQTDYKLQQDSEIHLATLKERNRIAREIHDNVGHLLSRALIMMGAIETVNKDDNLTPHLETLKSTLSDAMDSCRVSVHDLHDESIDLEGSLKSLVNDFTFCHVSLEYSSGSKINKDIKYCVISIVKESLSNISKHSNATEAKIFFREHANMYQLLIEDNGTTSINSDGTGIGLNNMQDRISALGGTFYINNESGFRIFATIPR